MRSRVLLFDGKVLSVLLAVLLAYLIPSSETLSIIQTNLTISGILLSGMLTTLAIVISNLGSERFAKLFKIFDFDQKEYDEINVMFTKFLSELKIDVKMVFLSFTVHFMILLILKMQVAMTVWLLAISVFLSILLLLLSLIAMYDVVNVAFTINALHQRIMHKEFDDGTRERRMHECKR